MTDLSLEQPATTSARRILRHALADAPAFSRLAIFLALSLVVTLAAAQIDGRLFQGENIWLKPVKFQLSLSLYLATLAVFARFMPSHWLGSRLWRAYAGIVVFAILAEMAWIAGAAAFGTGSHFNVASPLMSALYSVMGLFALILTSPTLVMGLAIARNPDTGLSPAMKLAIASGLILTFLLTVPVAGYMASTTGHHVGTPVTDARLWPMGWSREVGDLRVAHFFAAHALHFIPAGGLVAALALPPRAATTAVIAGTLAFVALTGSTFWQALNGLPFLP
ncbi:MAG: hypothetical protein RLZZ528_772 [Pseudomonadota bacterium]